MNLAQAVALRTQELLKLHGMSQYKLIKDTLLNKSTIYTLFKDRRQDVKLSTVYLIADFFGMSLAEFFDCDYFKNIDIYG